MALFSLGLYPGVENSSFTCVNFSRGRGLIASFCQATSFLKRFACSFTFHLIQNFIHSACLSFYTLIQQFSSWLLYILTYYRARHVVTAPLLIIITQSFAFKNSIQIPTRLNCGPSRTKENKIERKRSWCLLSKLSVLRLKAKLHFYSYIF